MGRKMELYAGMMENMDFHIGRLVRHLREIGEYDNTIFLVFGDNGAEGSDLFGMIAGTPGTNNYLFAAKHWSQTDQKSWGDPGSYTAYGAGWAQVSMTPFGQYKGFLGEGGIRNGLVVSGPVVKRPKGSIGTGLMSVGDIMPTLLEVAGATYPATGPAGDPPPLIGKSWVRYLAGEAPSPRTAEDYLAWEVFGDRAIRQGDWKLLWQYQPIGTAAWQLYDVAADPAERHDLAAREPDRVKALLALWDQYVAANNVILPSRSPFEGLVKTMPERFPVDAGYPPLLYERQFVPPRDMMADPKP
jgi:arylsulfatase